ncbi:MAG TPA: TonB-dependent receptor [candidate division Zixibacteria bacterium]|jgi:iron complex outermembrane receptor protein
MIRKWHLQIFIFLLLVIFLRPGYLFAKEQIETKGKQELLLFQEIKVVSASRYEQSLSDAPSSVTIITDQDIKYYGYKTLADVLRDVEGFDVIYDRNYEYVGVRGFARLGDYSTRILLLLNGHILNDNWIGSNLIGTDAGIDLDIVKKIEIVRGPGSALYGTNAFFAIINVVTYKPEELEGVRFSGELGSYGMKKGILGYGKKLKNGLELLGSFSLMDTKGDDLYFKEYNDIAGNGITRGTDYDRSWSFFGQISYKELVGYAKFSSRTKGVPTGSYETTFGDDRTRTIDGRNFVELNLVHPLSSNKKVWGKLSYDNMRYKGYWIYSDDPDYYLNIDKGVGDWVGIEGNYSWDFGSGNRLTFGGMYQRQYLKTFLVYYDQYGSQTYALPEESFYSSFWALYFQQEFKLRHNLNLTLGSHYDDYPLLTGVINPRIAFVYKPFGQSTFKILYGTAFRAPSIYEKYYTDEMTMVGNDKLDPEKVETIEGIWEQWLGNKAFTRISFYHNSITDLITQVSNADGMLQYQNSSAIISKGLELALNWKLTNRWEGFFNFVLEESKEKNTGEKLINVPTKMGNIGVVIPVYGEKFRVSLKENYSDKRKGKREDIEIDQFYITTLSLWSMDMIQNLECSLTIYNLFDQRYYNAAGEEHLQDKIEQDGRHLRFKLSYLLK